MDTNQWLYVPLETQRRPHVAPVLHRLQCGADAKFGQERKIKTNTYGIDERRAEIKFLR